MKYLSLPLLIVLLGLTAPAAAEQPPAAIIEQTVTYTVVKGDTLMRIGARLGVDWKRLARENSIDPRKPLKPGVVLKTSIRRIVPRTIENGIIINIPEKMLYFFKDGALAGVFPVGLGMPFWNGMTRWRTPVGPFKVICKEKNPTWYVPESMQLKMDMEGKEVKTVVPPGPDNPLGRYKIKTSIPGIVIHETIWPSSVYQFMSHGCIRMLPEHMEKFFPEVEITARGEVIYDPVKLARSADGRIFLEVHRDVYGKMPGMKAAARRLIEESGAAGRVDWNAVDRLLHEKSGVAEDITGWSRGEIF